MKPRTEDLFYPIYLLICVIWFDFYSLNTLQWEGKVKMQYTSSPEDGSSNICIESL